MERAIQCVKSDKTSSVWVDGRVVLIADVVRHLEERIEIATEALENIIDADNGGERIARRALASIKELNQ